jgi:hypothetical protein
MDWSLVERLVTPFVAAILGGLVSGGFVVYQTRRQGEDAAAQRKQNDTVEFDRILIARVAVVMTALHRAKNLCVEADRSLSRPGASIYIASHRAAVDSLLVRMGQRGEDILAAELLATSFANTADGRALADVARALADTRAAIDVSQEELRKRIADTRQLVESATESLRPLAEPGGQTGGNRVGGDDAADRP